VDVICRKFWLQADFKARHAQRGMWPIVAHSTSEALQYTTPYVYGSLWRWKHWSVRQIKPAQLAFGRTL